MQLSKQWLGILGLLATIAFVVLIFVFIAMVYNNDADNREFTASILALCRADDVDALFSRHTISLENGQDRLKQYKRDHPELTVTLTKITPEEYESKSKEQIRIFLDSYKDLWNAKFITFATPHPAPPKESGHKEIIWVQNKEGYHGIVIFNVVHTANGLRVENWNGTDRDYRRSEISGLRTKRAKLFSKGPRSFAVPEHIEYEFRTDRSQD